MDVSLSRDLEKLVQDKVKSGLYGSESDVVREALRLLEERDRVYRLRVESLRHEIETGITELDRDETVPATDVFRRLRKKAASRRKK